MTIAEAATQALEALTQCLSSDSANTIVVYDKFQKPFEGRHLQQEMTTLVTEGRGFGGACLPKDLDALIAAMAPFGGAPLLEAVANYNRRIWTNSH